MKVVNPLAQTFYVEQKTGIFVTSIDLYFRTKDRSLPITIQLRPFGLDKQRGKGGGRKAGKPVKKVYPFSQVTLEPKDIVLSEDATEPTTITFPSPVYLKGRQFHAIVLISNSIDYEVWTSKLGEIDVSLSGDGESNQVVVSKQPLTGGLFKSQNGSNWNEEPYEDLTFTLYRAKFLNSSGNITLYNPKLDEGNSQIARLVPDSLEMSSKLIRVGLSKTVNDSGLVEGNTITQLGSNATGNYVGTAGSATGNLTIVNAGLGYTPSAGQLTYTGVALTSITGSGYNATANVTIQNGVAIAATINNGGIGYAIGDVLTAEQIGAETLGKNLKISVSQLSGQNQLIIDNVQGDFITGVAGTIQYVNSSGITTTLNSSTGGDVTIQNDGIQTVTDGLHIRVNHKNHGMHSNTNDVILSNVRTNLRPVNLTSDFTSGTISVDSVGIFSTFENVGVSSTNPGYIKIREEILSYEGISGNTLTGVTRSIDSTVNPSTNYSLQTYPVGEPVYKYELNGISLRRINKQHSLLESSLSDSIGLDYYTIKIDTSQDGKTDPLPSGQVDRSVGTSFPKLYTNETKSLGGENIKATQNIQFEIIKPTVKVMSLNGTNITGRVRTVSGTSIDGSEISFIDRGFEDISLTGNNYFNNPRLICSNINESSRLSALPNNKSFSLELQLTSSSQYLSPTIDLDRTGMIFVSNRVNSPVQNYATDNRVATLENDPSSFVYATNTIQLEAPASSIKVIVAAHVNLNTDLRAFYAIQNDPSEELYYYPFPGYNNITNLGQPIDDSLSDGSSDRKVVKTDVLEYSSDLLPFTDHEFTIDKLAPFRYFSIKLIGTSTNQAFPPRLRDLRVIALAWYEYGL